MNLQGLTVPRRLLLEAKKKPWVGLHRAALLQALDSIQKNPRVRKIFVHNSGAGKWLRQFYGRLEKCVRSAGKPCP